LDYESVKSINESLIYASVTGFPENSDLANKSAFDLTVQAMTGFMHITGEADGPPTKVGYAIVDVLTGQHITSGILASILHLERTADSTRNFKGEGQHVNKHA